MTIIFEKNNMCWKKSFRKKGIYSFLYILIKKICGYEVSIVEVK